jgi:hypothetical protein
VRAKTKTVYFSLAMAGLASPAIWRLSNPLAQSDITAHFQLAATYAEQGYWFTYSIYYPLIYIFTLGGNQDLVQVSSFILLTILTAIKAGTALHFARKLIANERLAQIVGFTYVFAMPIVNPFQPDDAYLGQFSANVWHNSTTIMASIFVLPAFWFGVGMLGVSTKRSTIFFSLSLLGLVASKPSYAMALIPVLGTIAIWNALIDRQSNSAKRLYLLTIAVAPSIILLVFEYLVVFFGTVRDEGSIALVPFALWNAYSTNLPLSLILSLAGPIAVVWAYGLRESVRDRYIAVAGATLFVAISQYILLAGIGPDGAVDTAGNWTWGVIPAMGVVFFVCTSLVLTKLASVNTTPTDKIPWLVSGGLIFLHVLSGLYYVLSVGVDGFRTYVM